MLTNARAQRLAAKLDLDLERIEICSACLGMVAIALDGDERELRRATFQMTPDLWAEGLERPLRLALEQAHRNGVPDSGAALADIERAGARTAIARAVVHRLALQLRASVRAVLN